MKAHAKSTTPTSMDMTENSNHPKCLWVKQRATCVWHITVLGKNINLSQVPVGNELYHSGFNVHGENWPVLSIRGEATQIQDCTTVVSMYMVKNRPVLGIRGEAANKTQLYDIGVNVHDKKLTSVGWYSWWSHKQDMTVSHWCQCYNVHCEKNWPVLEPETRHSCTTLVSMYTVKKLTSVGWYSWGSHKQDMTVPHWCQCTW